MPTLKAFSCWITGNEGEPSIRIAATASKARAAYWRYLGDCCPDLKIHQVYVRRAPAHDIIMPDIPSEAADLSQRAREIVVHTFGGGDHIQPDQWGYRNHYCCAPSEPIMLDLVSRGIMTGPHGVEKDGGTDMWVGAFFYLTDLGKTVARALIGAREAAH